MKKIDSEKISKLGWIVYIKLFDDIGCEEKGGRYMDTGWSTECVFPNQ
jgi:hypothetical protein